MLLGSALGSQMGKCNHETHYRRLAIEEKCIVAEAVGTKVRV
jgi:hypothetical protein